MTLQFRTNINCGNCVRAVSGALNSESRIQHWSVDTEHPDKILTVESKPDSALDATDVVGVVNSAGFDAELRVEV